MTHPPTDKDLREVLYGLDVVCVMVFAAEIVLKVQKPTVSLCGAAYFSLTDALHGGCSSLLQGIVFPVMIETFKCSGATSYLSLLSSFWRAFDRKTLPAQRHLTCCELNHDQHHTPCHC